MSEINEQRALDLLRYARGYLFDEGLITQDEYASLLLHDGAVPRLEGYDALHARIAQLETDLRLANIDKEDRYLQMVAERNRAGAAEARVSQLESALRHYGRHIPMCSGEPCTCEYWRLLDQKDRPRNVRVKAEKKTANGKRGGRG